MTAPDDIRIYNGVFEGGDTILQQIEELSLRMQKITKRSQEASNRVQGVGESTQEIRQRAQKLEQGLLRMDDQDARWGEEELHDEVEKINERLEQMNIPNREISPADSPVPEKFSFGAPSLLEMSQLVVYGAKLNEGCSLRSRSRSPRKNNTPMSNQSRPRMESFAISKRKRYLKRYQKILYTEMMTDLHSKEILQPENQV